MNVMERLIDGRNMRRPARAMRRKLHPFLERNGLGSLLSLESDDELSECMADAVAEMLDGRIANHPFTYLEFGVSRVASLPLAQEVLRAASVTGARIVGFHSDGGLPAEAERQERSSGMYPANERATRRSLSGLGVAFDDVDLVHGSFDDTLTVATRSRLSLDRADLIIIGCCTHLETKVALQFAFPLVGDRAIVMFDNWERREQAGEPGQKEAFGAVLSEHSRIVAEPRPSRLPHARAFCLKHCSLL
jgi:O-methyltransferase